MTLSVITHSPDALVRHNYGQTVGREPHSVSTSAAESRQKTEIIGIYLTANLIRVVDEVQSVNQVTEVATTKV